MQAFKVLKLLDADPVPQTTWPELLASRIGLSQNRAYGTVVCSGGLSEVLSAALTGQGSVRNVRAAVEALQWLGVTNTETPVPLNASNALDALCVLMERKLAYDETERDMVVRTHKFMCMGKHTWIQVRKDISICIHIIAPTHPPLYSPY